MTSMEKAERFAGMAPALNQAERDSINALFPAYIFRRSKTREVWTTCCHRHETIPPLEARSEKEHAVLAEPHQREAKNRWMDAPVATTECPYCGRMTIVKELGRTGGRDNLSSYRRAVIFRWYRGALWARAYDFGKHYKDGCSLTGDPVYKLVGVYRFRPGLVEATTQHWWGDSPFSHIDRQNGPLMKGRWNIPSPFNSSAEYGMGYDVIGLEEIQKSPLRYCMVDGVERKFTYFVQFLTACCFYSRQIEMLLKAGMSTVAQDFIERGVKHAMVINWEESDPAKAFKVSRQDLKTFLKTNRDIGILELYKKLKERVPLTECAEWVSLNTDIKGTFQEAKKWNLPPEKLLRYLAGQVGCAQYGGLSSMYAALRAWKDYLTAAEAMGYQLHHENVLLPRKLGMAHDEATKLHREQLERERQAAQRERDQQRLAEQRERDRLMAETYAKRRAKLEEKYSFELDGYVIRVPESGEEILKEGRKLQHCVGGYANRHVQGKTTILFMRKANKPDEPWLTIEMDGNKLEQIHGYRNEGVYTLKGRFAPDPAKVYKDFLDTWLDWLKKGSKRDKDGRPKIPKKKGAAA